MSQICPHCAYARKPSDDVPDWQCPACEKAYAKVAASMPDPAVRQSVANNQTASSGGRLKWLMILLVLGAAFWFGRPMVQQPMLANEAALAAGQPEVVLYATDWCGYCKAARAFFAANDIRYVEHNIEKNSEALSQHKKLGGNGVPLIVVGNDVIKGYNEAALRQYLKQWIKS